ncbi:MAG: DMT family transporter [Pseudomonadota bacterium]
MAQRMGPVEWALLVALAVLWGGSFFLVGVAVAELPPLTIVVLRVGLAAAVLLPLAAALGDLSLSRSVWLAFLGMGVLNNAIPFTLIVWGQTQIASGLASILNATTPIFGVLVAHALTQDERLSGPRLAGVVLGFLGVAAMLGPEALAGIGDAVLAQLAVLGAAVSYAFAGVYGRRFRAMGVTPVAAAAGQVTCSALVLLPAALLVEQPWSLPAPGTATLSAVLALAVLSTALAYLLYFQILARAGATNLLLVTFLIPAVAIVLGIALLDERLGPEHLVGLGLILAGLAAIDGRVLPGKRVAQSRSGNAHASRD